MKATKPMVLALVLAVAAIPVLAKKDKDKDKAKPAAAAAASDSSSDVAAYLGDEPITRQDIDKLAATALMKVRQDEYNIRRNALDAVVQDKLLDKEASDRKISRADLLKAEIDDKAGNPSKDEINDFYEKNKGRMAGKTLEQVSPDIEKALRQQKLGVRRAAFMKELMDKAQLKVLLEPPRVDVPVPSNWPGIKGPATAPVTLIEFSDYQCPYCKRAEPTVAQLLSDYGDKIRFVYRDYPLQFHPRALPASLAAHCAADQGKFWELHKNLMNEQGDLSDDDIKKRAGTVGLDATAFNACYEAKKHESEVQASFQDGQNVGVTGTPSFFVNGRMLVGARSIEEFKSLIDEELARAAGRQVSDTK